MTTSDEDDRLVIRDLEAAATARIRATKHIIHSDQIIARFGELGAVVITGSGRQAFLLGAPQPANLKF